jgi:dTMP kinase
MTVQARLITLEGIDGVGKTTHVARLVAYLAGKGLAVATYREPGATPLGEELRQLLKRGVVLSAAAEMLMFATARAELVASRVKPDLAGGTWVVLDRFTESTLAYQGALDQIPEDVLRAVCRAAAGGLVPDLTLWLDIEPEAAVSRRYPLEQALNGMEVRNPDAIEQRSLEYFTRVRERYAAFWRDDPQRILRIDAGGSIEEIAALIREAVDTRLGQWSGLSEHV